MLIAKNRIRTETKTFETGMILSGLSSEETARLLRLGAAACIEEARIQIPEEAPNLDEADFSAPELKAFELLLEEMTIKEQMEYAKKAGIDLEKARTKKEIMEKLLRDAQNEGVDISAMSEGRLFFYAQKLGVTTEGKERAAIEKEIEVMVSEL